MEHDRAGTEDVRRWTVDSLIGWRNHSLNRKPTFAVAAFTRDGSGLANCQFFSVRGWNDDAVGGGMESPKLPVLESSAVPAFASAWIC